MRKFYVALLEFARKTKWWVVLNTTLKSSKRGVKVCALKDESGLSKFSFAQRLYR
jgi:hypothetical protein